MELDGEQEEQDTASDRGDDMDAQRDAMGCPRAALLPHAAAPDRPRKGEASIRSVTTTSCVRMWGVE